VKAHAKLNLALVVGPLRDDGKHEVVTLYQRLELHDDVVLRPARALEVEGFAEDTLVRRALAALAASAGVEPGFAARIEKRIPVAAGLGGGSSDAAAALLLANATLERPLPVVDLEGLAAALGADVPFFLREGPQLGTGDGSELAPVELPQDYTALILLRDGDAKRSTAEVYRAFDARAGATGWEDRRTALIAALRSVRTSDDLAGLPPNDLASTPLAAELRRHGAFRADVSGAGPAVYGLFTRAADAEAASAALGSRGRTWITAPAW
jgi:4-diphosphocytidyl-2-C-methyl-D-erythritol kinase